MKLTTAGTANVSARQVQNTMAAADLPTHVEGEMIAIAKVAAATLLTRSAEGWGYLLIADCKCERLLGMPRSAGLRLDGCSLAHHVLEPAARRRGGRLDEGEGRRRP